MRKPDPRLATPDSLDPSYRHISLSQGKLAKVSVIDYEFISCFRWFYSKHTHGAVRNVSGRRGGSRSMESDILPFIEGRVRDHINGDRLDNRRENLRYCLICENGRNRKMSSNNTSGHKGISWDKKNKKWFVSIRFNYKMIALGRFHEHELDKAIKVRENKERELFGEFVRNV